MACSTVNGKLNRRRASEQFPARICSLLPATVPAARGVVAPASEKHEQPLVGEDHTKIAWLATLACVQNSRRAWKEGVRREVFVSQATDCNTVMAVLPLQHKCNVLCGGCSSVSTARGRAETAAGT